MRVGVLPTASSHHRDSFSTAARNPFLLASLAADTSSPLPGSFAPQNLFKEPAIPLQTRSSLFPTITTLLSPATSSYTIPSFSLKTPHGNQASPCRLHSLPNDASTQPPSAIPAMLSTLQSSFQLTSPWLSSPFSGIRFTLLLLPLPLLPSAASSRLTVDTAGPNCDLQIWAPIQLRAADRREHCGSGRPQEAVEWPWTRTHARKIARENARQNARDNAK